MTSRRSWRSWAPSGGQAEVIQDHDIGLGPAGEQPRVGAVGARDVELLHEARDAAIEDGVAVAARLVSKRARQVRLPAAGGAAQDHVLVLGDPLAGGEALPDAAVEAAGVLEVDVLEARGAVTEAGELQAAGDAAPLALAPLAVDEEADALLEREVGVGVGLRELLLQRARERIEPEFAEFLEGLLGGHASPFV
jgi:hypothetical protein